MLPLRDPDEAAADQWSRGEIERRTGLLAAQARKFLFNIVPIAHIMFEHRQVFMGWQQFNARLSIGHTKDTA